MEITTRTIGNCQVLDLNGRLFLGPATKNLRNTFSKVAEKKPPKIVVNMQNVTHIDTTGLGELISCYCQAKSLGRNLVLLNPQDKVMHVLISTKLKTVFDIFYDEALAVTGSDPHKGAA